MFCFAQEKCQQSLFKTNHKVFMPKLNQNHTFLCASTDMETWLKQKSAGLLLHVFGENSFNSFSFETYLCQSWWCLLLCCRWRVSCLSYSFLRVLLSAIVWNCPEGINKVMLHLIQVWSSEWMMELCSSIINSTTWNCSFSPKSCWAPHNLYCPQQITSIVPERQRWSLMNHPNIQFSRGETDATIWVCHVRWDTCMVGRITD